MPASIPAHRVVGPFHFLPTFILAHYPLLLNRPGVGAKPMRYRYTVSAGKRNRRYATPVRMRVEGGRDVAEALGKGGGGGGSRASAWLRRCGVWFGTGWGDAMLGGGNRSRRVGGGWGVVLAAVLAAVPAWSWAQLDEAELGKQVVTVRVYKGGDLEGSWAGVVVNDQGDVLTSAEVLAAGRRVAVVVLGEEEEAGGLRSSGGRKVRVWDWCGSRVWRVLGWWFRRRGWRLGRRCIRSRRARGPVVRSLSRGRLELWGFVRWMRTLRCVLCSTTRW